MANTYTLIASNALNSGAAANMVFSSIPSTYTDLLLKVSLRSVSNQQNWILTFNSINSGYSQSYMWGDGASTSQYNPSGASNILGYAQNNSTATANTFNNGEIYIPNYASSMLKPLSIDEVSENNGTTAYQAFTAGLVSNSATISSITISGFSGNLAQYSTVYLYGIKNS